MNWRRSIKSRLLVTLVVSLIAMFFLLWWVVSTALQELTANYLEDRMELEIASILAELALDDQDLISLDGKHVDALFHFSFSGYYYQIILQDGEESQILRSRSLNQFTLDIPAVPVGDQIRFFAKGPKDENLLTLVRTIPLRERKLTVAVAEDLTPIEEDLEQFLWLYSIISVVFLLLLTIIHVVAVYRAMSPIARIHQDVMHLEMGQIGKLSEDVPVEMKKVVGQINHLLSRMEQRLLRSRTTITNLAHAMKSPLATLFQIVHHPVLGGDEKLRSEIEERLNHLSELIDRELRRARLTDFPLDGMFFYPEQSLGILTRTLKNINFQKKIDVEMAIPSGITLPFDQEDMMELFGNLLDNAFKWASSRIRVVIEVRSEEVYFVVEDDGPGVEPLETDHLAVRGVRLDESRPGHGLGLSLVRETVTHYAGTMRFPHASELGGFRVEIALPVKPGVLNFPRVVTNGHEQRASR
ncbi:MAG: GHKL domain-containing protein [Magnetococcales bacterium]|nr:GHKL domain-containing protein [Magnetococcales bacterium]MBF0260769.1 GHKL domain-containing protein [Magnetococcales bacterium]